MTTNERLTLIEEAQKRIEERLVALTEAIDRLYPPYRVGDPPPVWPAPLYPTTTPGYPTFPTYTSDRTDGLGVGPVRCRCGAVLNDLWPHMCAGIAS